MPRRKRDSLVSNDEDLVQYTQYHHTKAQLPSKYDDISSYPQFDPLELVPIDNPGPNLSQDVNLSDPETLFLLYFDDRILNQLISCTNACAVRSRDVS
jgi:hypothetical protein